MSWIISLNASASGALTGNRHLGKSTANKIKEFGNLPYGWHFGEGIPAHLATIQRALSLLDELNSLGLTRTDAFYGADGSLMLTAYRKDHCLEVLLEPDGSSEIVHEIDNQEVFSDTGDAKQLIRKCAKEIFGSQWALYDSSTQITMTRTEGDSLVWRSATPPMEVAHRSLMLSA